MPVRFLYAGNIRARMLEPTRLKTVLDSLGAESVFLADDAEADDRDFSPGPLSETHLAEIMTGFDPERTLAMICGPAGMTTFACDVLHRTGLSLDNIRYERFSYDVAHPSMKDKAMMMRFFEIGSALAALILAFSAGRSLLG
ncbi:ferredoxin-NADP reductase [Labrenzia sp. MBR-25]|jgi:ferredoxin-NADP reductase